VKIHTSLNPAFSCAICGVSIDGMSVSELDSQLYNKYKIHTVGIVWENINCVRVTPHVYTREKDLDKLIVAIETLATK
jgi:selenocysteine lyase/cysteine desulfurase